MQGLLSVQVLRQLFSEAKVPLPFESDYWYTGSGFFLTSLGLAYFAKEKSDALQHIGLPDPAVLEQKQRKHRPLTMCRFFRSSPSLRKVQAMYRRLLNRSKRKVSAEVVELVDTLP